MSAANVKQWHSAGSPSEAGGQNLEADAALFIAHAACHSCTEGFLHFMCLCTTCRDVAYRGFWFFPWLFAKPEPERQAVIQKTLKLMEDKVMDPPIGE